MACRRRPGDAGAVLDQPDLVEQHHAVEFGLRAAAQHDRDIVGAGAGDGALEAVGHGEESQQHRDDEADRGHRRQRRQQPLGRLLRLIMVTASICRKIERIGSAPA